MPKGECVTFLLRKCEAPLTKMTTFSRASALNFLVCSHRYVYGNTESLLNYLSNARVGRLVSVLHDLPGVDHSWAGKDSTIVEEYTYGKLVTRRVLRTGGGDLLHYLMQFILTLRVVLGCY